MSHASEIRAQHDAVTESYITNLLSEAVAPLLAEISSLAVERDQLRESLTDATDEIAVRDARIAELLARIAELEEPEPEPEPPAGPSKFFPATAEGIAAARTYYGVPSDANAVLIRATETRDLEAIHASGGANDVFFLEDREEPYWLDVSRGFMAPSVKEYDGIDVSGKIDRVNRVQVTNPGTRAWFGFTRTRRGIIGLGPRVTIAPKGTLLRPSFAVLQDQTHLPAGERYQRWYKSDGTQGGSINGCPVKLLECETSNPIFAGFTLKGPDNDFGGMQYGGLSIKGSGVARVVDMTFDGCWHSGAGVPNTETGALSFNGIGHYIDRIRTIAVGPTTSSIMTNNSPGGTMRRSIIAKVTNGMMTHWRPTGLHIMEDIHLDGGQAHFNLEELRPGFELRWTRGSLKVDRGRHHFGINPYVPGSGQPAPPKITLIDVEVSQDAWAFVNSNGSQPGLDLNAYQGSATDPVCAKTSWISHVVNGVAQPVRCVPSVRWVS